MRIAFVIRKLADRSGGAERVLIESANALNRRGHNVDILSFEPRRTKPFYPIEFGVRHLNLQPPKTGRSFLHRHTSHFLATVLRHFPYTPITNVLLWRQDNGDFIRRLRQYIDWNSPDVLIPFMPPAITASVIAAQGQVPVVSSLHNAPEQDFNNPARWDPNPHDIRVRHASVLQSSRIVVLLPEYRDWFESEVREKVVVVGNSVHLASSTDLRSAKRENVVLAVGRLADVKRHDLLIRAWHMIKDKRPDWSVKIFGVGPAEKHLRALIADLGLQSSVHLMGHTQNIKSEYLKSAMLAHPAQFEGFPLAVTEALANGLPVIGFEDCSGLNRLVADGVNGVLVPAGTDRTGLFSAALDRLIEDSAARQAMSMAAPTTMYPYHPDSIIDEWERILRDIVQARLAASHVHYLSLADNPTSGGARDRGDSVVVDAAKMRGLK